MDLDDPFTDRSKSGTGSESHRQAKKQEMNITPWQVKTHSELRRWEAPSERLCFQRNNAPSCRAWVMTECLPTMKASACHHLNFVVSVTHSAARTNREAVLGDFGRCLYVHEGITNVRYTLHVCSWAQWRRVQRWVWPDSWVLSANVLSCSLWGLSRNVNMWTGVEAGVAQLQDGRPVTQVIWSEFPANPKSFFSVASEVESLEDN